MIYSLCYVSTKRKNLTPSEVRSIIDYSNKKNSFDNITGILIEYKNNFIQYLEGDAIRIYELFEKIKSDPRHEKVSLLQYSPIEERLFEGWSMSHRDLDIIIEKDDQLLECAKSLDDVILNKSFWNGIKTIEVLSNLN